MAFPASGCRLVLVAVVASFCATHTVSLLHMTGHLDSASQHLFHVGDSLDMYQKTIPYNATAPTNLSATLSMLNQTIDYITAAVEKVNETINTKLLQKFYNATKAMNGILVGMQTHVDTLANLSATFNQSNRTEPYLEAANSTIASLKESLNETNETVPASIQNLTAGLSEWLEAIQNQTDKLSALLGGVQAAADIAASLSNFSKGKSAEELKQVPEEPEGQAKTLCEQANQQMAAATEKVGEYTEEFITLNETLVTNITTFIETSNATLSSMNSSIAEQLESGTLPESLDAQFESAQSLIDALQTTFAAVADVLLGTVLPNATAVVTPILDSAPDYVAWAQQMVDAACAFPVIGNSTSANSTTA